MPYKDSRAQSNYQDRNQGKSLPFGVIGPGDYDSQSANTLVTRDAVGVLGVRVVAFAQFCKSAGNRIGARVPFEIGGCPLDFALIGPDSAAIWALIQDHIGIIGVVKLAKFLAASRAEFGLFFHMVWGKDISAFEQLDDIIGDIFACRESSDEIGKIVLFKPYSGAVIAHLY